MKPGYTVTHLFEHESLGEFNSVAEICNDTAKNEVSIFYWAKSLPFINQPETVAIFKLKPKAN